MTQWRFYVSELCWYVIDLKPAIVVLFKRGVAPWGITTLLGSWNLSQTAGMRCNECVAVPCTSQINALYPLSFHNLGNVWHVSLTSVESEIHGEAAGWGKQYLWLMAEGACEPTGCCATLLLLQKKKKKQKKKEKVAREDIFFVCFIFVNWTIV